MPRGSRQDVGGGKIWKDVVRQRGHKKGTKLPGNFGDGLAG